MSLTNNGSLMVQIPVPAFFLCPISLELMLDPVTLSSGQTFDRSSIQTWLDDGNGSCPVTRLPINAEQEEPIPNHALRRMIQTWCVQNKGFGIERIHTPRQPPSLKDIPDLLDQIRASINDDDHMHHLCGDAIQKLCMLASNRQKARHLLLRTDALHMLSLCLSKTLPPCRRKAPSVEVEDTLHLLAILLEESEEVGLHRFSWETADVDEVLALAEIIAAPRTRIDLRRNAAVVLSKAASLMEFLKREMGAIDGFMTRVIGLIREASAASMATSLQYSCNPSSFDDIDLGTAGLGLLLVICKTCKRNQHLAIEGGALDVIASLLVTLSSDAITCPDNHAHTKTIELGLRVWESLCKCAEGRAASMNLMGLLLRLMCNVSNKATKYATRILWLLLKFAPMGAPVVEHAVKQGAFLKAMAVAQGDTSLKTRSLASKIARALGRSVITSNSLLNLE